MPQGSVQRLRSKFGLTDKKLLRDGLVAQGRVLKVQRTSIVIGIAQKFQVCQVELDVELDGYPPYTATCLHPIHQRELEHFERGGEVVVVRVDPDDHDNVALDFAADAEPKPKKSRRR